MLFLFRFRLADVVNCLIFCPIISSFFLYRLTTVGARRTELKRMVTSESDLQIHVQNLGCLLPLKGLPW